MVRYWPEAAHGCLVLGAPPSIRKHSPRNETTDHTQPAIEDGPRGLCVDPLTFTYHGVLEPVAIHCAVRMVRWSFNPRGRAFR